MVGFGPRLTVWSLAVFLSYSRLYALWLISTAEGRSCDMALFLLSLFFVFSSYPNSMTTCYVT